MLRNALYSFSLVALICAAASFAFAKESKYDRPKKKAAVEVPAATSGPNAAASPAPDAKDSKKAAAGNGEKLDITDLENRYWAPKDTEFSVVQNRLYTKAKKFSVEPTLGVAINDAYNSLSYYGVVGNYYFSERSGVELQMIKASGADSDLVQAFRARNGVTPNYNRPLWYVGAGYNWVPIYAKMSFLEKKILYFDMFVTPGLGVTALESNQYSGTGSNVATVNGVSQTAVTFSLDIGQQVFFSEHLALRLDIRNHWYSEKIYDAATGSQERTRLNYAGTLMLGVTYFFNAPSTGGANEKH